MPKMVGSNPYCAPSRQRKMDEFRGRDICGGASFKGIRISEELAGRMKPFSDVGWSHSSMQLPHLAQEILRWRHK